MLVETEASQMVQSDHKMNSLSGTKLTDCILAFFAHVSIYFP